MMRRSPANVAWQQYRVPVLQVGRTGVQDGAGAVTVVVTVLASRTGAGVAAVVRARRRGRKGVRRYILMLRSTNESWSLEVSVCFGIRGQSHLVGG